MTQSRPFGFKKVFASPLFIFLASLLLIFLSISLVRETYRKYQLGKEIAGLKEEIAKTEKEKNSLADLMESLRSESHLEKEARLKLNLKKPGEEVVIFSGPLTEEDPEKVPDNFLKTDLAEIEKPNYLKWWNYFFGP